MATRLTPSQQALDATEQIEVFPLAHEEVLRMVQAGEIEDAKSIAMLLYPQLIAGLAR